MLSIEGLESEKEAKNNNKSDKKITIEEQFELINKKFENLNNLNNNLEKKISYLEGAEQTGVVVMIRKGDNVTIPSFLNKFILNHGYITTPLTMIDNMIVWFGEPLSSADFMSEGDILETMFFPCLRFEGKYTARMLKAIYEMTTV